MSWNVPKFNNGSDESGESFVPFTWSGVNKYAAETYWDLVRMKYEYDANQSWYDENESPKAKLRQFVELGVNPHSAMESILGLGTNATQGADMGQTHPGPSPVDAANVALDGLRGSVDGISNMVRLGIDGSVANHQNLLAASQARWYDANIPKVGAEKLNIEQDTKNKAAQEDNTKVDTKKKEQEIENIKQELKNLQKQYELDDEQLNMLRINNASLAEMNQAQIEEIRARTADYIASASERRSNILRNEILNQETISNIAVNDATIAEKGASVALMGAEKDLAEKKASNIEEDTAGKKFINDWQSATGCPIGADEAKYIESLANKGEHVRIQNYMNAKLDIAARTGQFRTSIDGSFGFGLVKAGASNNDYHGQYQPVYQALPQTNP